MMVTKPMAQQTSNRAGGYLWAPGDQPIEGYTVVRGLGIGGFGEVYLATTAAGKEVAIKRIRRNAAVELRGTRHCLNLRHPNLVQLFDLQQIDDHEAWIAMEYIAGQTLREVIDAHPDGMPADQALELFGQLASAVAYLHSQGIVHRDLKPANIFIEAGFVKIGDYGLSKVIADSQRDGHTSSIGTFHYMAPEISRGQYGKEIDIYALGVVLYEMLTGRVPFDGQSVEEIVIKHLTDEPDLAGLPQPAAGAIAVALRKDPVARYSDVSQLLAALKLKPLGLGDPAQPTTSRQGDHAAAYRDAATRTHEGVQPFTVDPRRTGHAARVGGPAKRANRFGGQPPYAEPAAESHWEEPIAAAVVRGVRDLWNWWRGIDSAVVQAIVLAAAALLMVRSAGIWAGLAYWAAIVYPIYYCVRHLTYVRRKERKKRLARIAAGAAQIQSARALHATPHQAGGETLRHQPPADEEEEEPIVRLPFRQWQAVQRVQLANRSTAERMAEWTGSVFYAGMVCGVLAVLGWLAGLAFGLVPATPLTPMCVWTATVVWFAATTILLVSKLWETRPEDQLTYRFAQVSLGLAIGLVAYGLDTYLHLPWDMVSDRSHPMPQHFYEGYDPKLPAYLSFFAVLMGFVRWWRSADRLRKSRLSIVSIVFASVLAAFISGLLAFPTFWGVVIAAGLSMALQVSSYYTPR